jgi:hypothetical protein
MMVPAAAGRRSPSDERAHSDTAAFSTGNDKPACGTVTVVDDTALNLHVMHHRRWLTSEQAASWWTTIMENVRWFRVKYKSARFQKECETPCWTTFFGGNPKFAPFEPVPSWL